MAKTDFRSVDDYIATFPPDVQATLQAVRRAIREALPEAEEGISYQMPTFRLHGPLLHLAAYKRHYSLFGVTQGVLDALGKDLARYEGTGRGTLRFPLDEPVPVKLIQAIARRRAEENQAGDAKT
jgi:uncharacterized protein YdhG (YjbR/CyaY superfamily)